MNDTINILLVEDEPDLVLIIRNTLTSQGFNVRTAMDGEEGLRMFYAEKPDVLVADVMMPKMDGFTLARELRMINAEVPIMFLTAKNLKDDILEGFKLGADDYLTKPFSMDELVYRMEAILRRVKARNKQMAVRYQLGRFVFDTQRQLLTIGEKSTKLTTKESELLTMLCTHMNDVLERDLALKTIWIDDNYFNARSMDVYITKLRKHLKDDPNVEINNVHGKGYRLVVPYN